MTSRFELPVGSHADTKELEYISAIHQTSKEFRRDGTIEAEDIAFLLLSRYGIQVEDLQAIEKEILVDFAGETADEPRKRMDIRQLASLLLLPHLAMCGSKSKTADNGDEDSVGRVFRVLCADLKTITNTDAAQSSKSKPKSTILTRQTIRQLFQIQGEQIEISEAVIDEMLQAAGGEGVALNQQTFLRALTHDLSGYNVAWESTLSTRYADILGANPMQSNTLRGVSMFGMFGGASARPSRTSSAHTLKDYNLNIEEPELRKDLQDKAHKVISLAELDNIAETYASQAFSMLLWVAFISVFIAYVYSNEETRNGMIECEGLSSEFGCKVKNAIVDWLSIFVQLMILGGTFFAFSTAGNSIFIERGCVSILRVLVGMGTVVFFTIVPLHVVMENWFINSNSATNNGLYKFFPYIAYVIGLVLLLIQIHLIARLVVSSESLQSDERLRSMLTPGATRKELNSKRAAVFKTDRLVENALKLYPATSDKSPTSSKAVASFLASSFQTESSPGVHWVWKSFLNGSICREEGVWFHTRLLATSVSHVLVLFVTFSLMYWALDEVDRAFGGAVGDNDASLTTDPVRTLAQWLANNAQRSDVAIGLGVGCTFSFLGTLWTLYSYIPSFVFNVMKFRYGVIPSLYSLEFKNVYREAADHTTEVFGIAFWASLFSAFFSFTVTGMIAFLSAWARSTSLVQSIVAQLVGISSTVAIKVGFIYFARKSLLAGYYRKKLAQANVLFMLLECWNIAISTGFLVARTAVFLFLSVFYIARIDTPFLAPGIDRIDQLPTFFLDLAPVYYRQDLLLHEAHRHPYMDRLASLYLLKLSLGGSFGTRAGSCWRLLYTLSLMPWLRTYAVHASDNAEGVTTIGASMRGASPRELMLEEEVTRLRAQSTRLLSKLQSMQGGEKPLTMEMAEIEEEGEETEEVNARVSAFSV